MDRPDAAVYRRRVCNQPLAFDVCAGKSGFLGAEESDRYASLAIGPVAVAVQDGPSQIRSSRQLMRVFEKFRATGGLCGGGSQENLQRAGLTGATEDVVGGLEVVEGEAVRDHR